MRRPRAGLSDPRRRWRSFGCGSVYSTALQTDGKIIIGGIFTTVGGTARNNFARLNTDGTLAPGSDPNVADDSGAVVFSTAVQADGKIVIGGFFTTVGGTARNRIARLENDPATQSLTVTSASRMEWLRGGASPETLRVTFELSINGGMTWTSLGAGTRIAGGWEKTGLSLPASGLLRARARVTDGAVSSGLVETVAAFPPNASPTVANSIADFAVNEDAADTVIDLRAVFQDAETADADLIFTVQANGSPTPVAATADNMADTLILDYQANQFGTASITVRAADDSGQFVEDTFVVTVNQVQNGGPGDVDADFNPIVVGNFSAGVSTTAVQADAKIVIGGAFNMVDGTARNHVARLNADGTLDSGFNPNAQNSVGTVAVQADGKIVIGGNFFAVGGTTRTKIARLDADGMLDPGFNPDIGPFQSSLSSTAVQADGKILIGGFFTTVNGSGRNNLARLNVDGTLDSGFNPNASSSVNSVAVQADGKILIGGGFSTVGGTARNRIARLNMDGTLDPGFNPNADDYVSSIAVQADGKIVIGGGFTILGGVARNRLARLNADGTLDPGFNPDIGPQNTAVYTTADFS